MSLMHIATVILFLALPATGRVNITAEPRVVVRGHQVELTCPHVGFPTPEVEWFKDGKAVVDSGKGIVCFLCDIPQGSPNFGV